MNESSNAGESSASSVGADPNKTGMSQPYRVQLSRKAGWRMPENTVKVARPTRWGNPYRVSSWMTLDLSLRLFEETLRGFWSPNNVALLTDEQSSEVYAAHCAWRKRHSHHPLECARTELRGMNLACWCDNFSRCHADILLRIANDFPVPPGPSGSTNGR